MGVGRTFQRNNLFQNLSVTENIGLALQIRHGKPLDLFYASRKQHSIVRTCRGFDGAGPSRQRRRAARPGIVVRRATTTRNRPRSCRRAALLLLDEPTSGMSPSETARIIDLIAALPRTFSILMIEHDMKVVFSVADRITVLDTGTGIFWPPAPLLKFRPTTVCVKSISEWHADART